MWYPEFGGSAPLWYAKFAEYIKNASKHFSVVLARAAENLDGWFTKYASGPNLDMYVTIDQGPVILSDSIKYVSNCCVISGL